MVVWRVISVAVGGFGRVIHSPHIVIVMDALAMIIAKKVDSVDNFSYHWRCAEAKITHLCFADDLILFCGNNRVSVLILKQALDTFLSLSGLSANHSKSDIFIAGSDGHFKEFLLEVFGYQLGKLPARHWGVPLISTKLSSRDCKILLEKIMARIKNGHPNTFLMAGGYNLLNQIGRAHV